MGLQAAPSVFVIFFVWFIPESPRWYIGQGNQARAHELLTKYHGGGDPKNEIVQLEMREMVAAILVADGADKRCVVSLISRWMLKLIEQVVGLPWPV